MPINPITKISKGDNFLCSETFMRGDEQLYEHGEVYSSFDDHCITDKNGNEQFGWNLEILNDHFIKLEPQIINQDNLWFPSLIGYIGYHLQHQNCDHTYKLVHEAFHDFELINIDKPGTIKFLQENGGYCDCEILFNVVPKFENELMNAIGKEVENGN